MVASSVCFSTLINPWEEEVLFFFFFFFEEFSLAHLTVCLAKHFAVVARRCFTTSRSTHAQRMPRGVYFSA